MHPLETWEEFTRGSLEKMRVYFDRGEGNEAVYVEAGELGKIMLAAYLEEYGEDEQWDFIATERSGLVRIPVTSGSATVVYKYIYDGVYRDLSDGDIKLLETKTAAAISTDHLTLDDQAGSYWATANAELRKTGDLGPKQRIAGVTYNFLRKGIPDERPRHPSTGERCNKPTKDHYISAIKAVSDGLINGKEKLDDLAEVAETIGLAVYGEPSKSQPPPLFLRHFVLRTRKERNTQIRRIADEAVHIDAVRSGMLPIIKTPRSTGHDACQYGCDFFNMCELHEAGADWEQYRDAMYLRRDPREEYRKSAHAAS